MRGISPRTKRRSKLYSFPLRRAARGHHPIIVRELVNELGSRGVLDFRMLLDRYPLSQRASGLKPDTSSGHKLWMGAGILELSLVETLGSAAGTCHSGKPDNEQTPTRQRQPP